MRTDCTIDNEPIPCPAASLVGFGRGAANVGDLIVYHEVTNDGVTHYRTARVLGRVTAPKLHHEGSVDIKGWALCLVLSNDCTYAYERWVNPKDIDSVREVPTRMLEFFARPTLPDVQLLRHKLNAGYLVDHYLADSGL